jgi:adenylosuccinate lyase
MAQHLELSEGRCYSEAVLLALVRAGLPRQQAYALVQRAAMTSAAGAGRFRDRLAADPEVRAVLSEAELDQCLTPAHALRWVDAIIERALASP